MRTWRCRDGALTFSWWVQGPIVWQGEQERGRGDREEGLRQNRGGEREAKRREEERTEERGSGSYVLVYSMVTCGGGAQMLVKLRRACSCSSMSQCPGNSGGGGRRCVGWGRGRPCRVSPVWHRSGQFSLYLVVFPLRGPCQDKIHSHGMIRVFFCQGALRDGGSFGDNTLLLRHTPARPRGTCIVAELHADFKDVLCELEPLKWPTCHESMGAAWVPAMHCPKSKSWKATAGFLECLRACFTLTGYVANAWEVKTDASWIGNDWLMGVWWRAFALEWSLVGAVPAVHGAGMCLTDILEWQVH